MHELVKAGRGKGTYRAECVCGWQGTSSGNWDEYRVRDFLMHERDEMEQQ